jgi:cell division protein FtsL
VVATWQQLSIQEILNMLLGSILLLGGIMLTALCVVAAFTLLRKLLSKINSSK